MPMPTSQRPSRTWPGFGLRRSQPKRWAPSVMQRASWRVEKGLPVSGSRSGSLRRRSSMGSSCSLSASSSMAHSRLSMPEASPGARMGPAAGMSSLPSR